ncbi:MAG: pantetheine-phosphate adenylyltransferase [candidate division Zixibacteria bacterium]
MNKNEKKIAIYPGTFDPTTNGHISLIERAIGLFDELIVAVAKASTKKTLFTIDERLEIVQKAVAGKDRVRVESFEGLLANYARDVGACAVIRGLRAVSDFEFEFQMALMNRRIIHDIETVFLMPALSWVYLSSMIVKEVAANGGDISGLVPDAALEALNKKFRS